MQKGGEILLRAFRAILRSNPRAMLMLVGGGSLESSLKRLAAELGIAPRVIFAGPRPDARKLVSIFDVFVLPSLFESFPFTVVEAMMAAKPVVASDVGGVAEAVLDRKTGLLVEPGDEAALIQALTELLGQETRRGEMGQAGRERALDLFSAQAMVAATRSLYERLWKGH